MRAASLALILSVAISPSFPQENPDGHSAFGCSPNAVEVEWSRSSSPRIKPIPRLPGLLNYESHKFKFPALGPYLVEIYFSATVSEASTGRATLHIYAETTDAANDPIARRLQFWEIEPSDPNSFFEKISSSFSFNDARVRNCFAGTEGCSFATVALATPDTNLPIIAVNFGQNLDGANALNWTEASLLLDFRRSPPRLLATLDCAYNEGGGACTALDSGETPRTELHCDWRSESDDFLCSNNSTDGDAHLDFFLLTDQPVPLRPDEVATITDAVSAFKSKGTSAPVKARGIGPVSWVDEVMLDSANKLLILGSPGRFHFLVESKAGFTATTKLQPHPLIVDPHEVPFEDKAIGTFTPDHAVTFRSREIYYEKGLRVVQVVETDSTGSRQLYWLGIEGDATAARFDAIRLVGGAHYGSCGNSIIPDNVAAIEKISRPFQAQIRIQPETWVSDADESSYGWSNEPGQDQEAPNCIRTGRIVWKDGKFTATMDTGDCRFPADPKSIRLEPDGRIVVTDKPKRTPPEKSY